MARHDTPSNPQELEELGTEAIVAHQTNAHLPQRRVQVTEEQRSVVIAEPSPPRPKPLRPEGGEKTVVIRDRRELDVARQKLTARKKRAPRARAMFFGVLAAAILAGVAVGVFGVSAWRGSSKVVVKVPAADEATPTMASAIPAPQVETTPAPSASPPADGEAAPRAVSLDELPVEPSPARR